MAGAAVTAGSGDLAPDLVPQAEYDAMLLEHAGEAIPALAAVAGGDTFAPFFAGFLPLLLCKTVSAPSSGFEPHSAQPTSHSQLTCTPTPARNRVAQWQRSPLR